MIAEMRKLILIGSRSETRATLDLLHKSGCVELAPSKSEEGTFRPDVSKDTDALALKLADLEFAFEFIKNAQRQAGELSKKKDNRLQAGKGKNFSCLSPRSRLTNFSPPPSAKKRRRKWSTS